MGDVTPEKARMLLANPLFAGVSAEELSALLGCLSPAEHTYERDEFVLSPGDEVRSIGLVLEGEVTVVREDWLGNRNIVAVFGPGSTFAEAYACARDARIPVGVVATRPSRILFLGARRVLTMCSSACAFHTRLVENLVGLLATRNLALNEKLGHVSQRSTREKLLSYLSGEAARRGSASFDLALGRQQLADYLSVNRSAMCTELARMADEGLLELDGRHVVLVEQRDMTL